MKNKHLDTLESIICSQIISILVKAIILILNFKEFGK